MGLTSQINIDIDKYIIITGKPIFNKKAHILIWAFLFLFLSKFFSKLGSGSPRYLAKNER
tara:strand:+ start:569 stop:748 length:180 start_codon:yes stop_codon:yes gene_type:complete